MLHIKRENTTIGISSLSSGRVRNKDFIQICKSDRQPLLYLHSGEQRKQNQPLHRQIQR